MEVGECRNWADLPPELTYAILVRLSLIDKLENAQKVCKSWHRVCQDPSMWRKIDMRYSKNKNMRYDDLASMCRLAVDRSQGCLTEITIRSFGSDNLLNYIADRSSNLRCIRVQTSFYLSDINGLMRAIRKLPFLEELEILYDGKLDLKAIGHSCPLLKTFKLNYTAFSFSFGYNNDDDALAIAETMSELRHLKLSSNTITNSGLNAILDKCLHLEHLVLCRCLNIDLVGDLKKRCSERIRYLKCRGLFEGNSTARERALLGEGFSFNAME